MTKAQALANARRKASSVATLERKLDEARVDRDVAILEAFDAGATEREAGHAAGVSHAYSRKVKLAARKRDAHRRGATS